ncbi:Uncharacterised protein [Chlamydia trachomatis]|nr:Uncharacterised protein [Chlamydia trachomatis]
MEERVDDRLLGEEVLSLAPLLLRGVTVELERVFEEGLEGLEALRICLLPEGALLGPNVVPVPPREDDARIGAEDRGVAGGENDVIGRLVNVGDVRVKVRRGHR